MDVSLETALLTVQTLANISTVAAILLAVRQFRMASQQAKKDSDTTAVNFVLQAEGQFDSAMEALINAPPAIIRQAYAAEIDPAWTDADLPAFVFLKRLFGQVSRMVFIAHNRTLDLGMSEQDRDDLIADWENTLRKYRDHPIMRRIYENAMRNRDYNRHMLDLCAKVFGPEPGA